MEAIALKEEILLGFCLSWCSTASRPPRHRGCSDRCAKCKKPPIAGNNSLTQRYWQSVKQLLGRRAVIRGKAKLTFLAERSGERAALPGLSSCCLTSRSSTGLMLHGKTSTLLSQLKLGAGVVQVRLSSIFSLSWKKHKTNKETCQMPKLGFTQNLFCRWCGSVAHSRQAFFSMRFSATLSTFKYRAFPV